MSIAVVIGASAAGIAAAHSLSRRFRQVLLIERRAGLNLRQRFRTTANVHVWEDAEAVYLLPSAAGVGGVAIRQHRGARTQCVPAGLVVDATGNNAALEQWLDGIGWPRSNNSGNRRQRPQLPPGIMQTASGFVPV